MYLNEIISILEKTKIVMVVPDNAHCACETGSTWTRDNTHAVVSKALASGNLFGEASMYVSKGSLNITNITGTFSIKISDIYPRKQTINGKTFHVISERRDSERYLAAVQVDGSTPFSFSVPLRRVPALLKAARSARVKINTEG